MSQIFEFKKVAPGPLTRESADEINRAFLELYRILSLTVAPPLQLSIGDKYSINAPSLNDCCDDFPCFTSDDVQADVNDTLPHADSEAVCLCSGDALADALGSSGNTGTATICTGDSAGGNSGLMDIHTGTTPDGTTGAITIQTGEATDNNGTSGNLSILTGDTLDEETGNITISTGANTLGAPSPTGDIVLATGGSVLGDGSGLVSIVTGNCTSNSSGTIGIATGNSTDGDSGAITISTGNCDISGDITLSTGDANAVGGAGSIRLETGFSAGGTQGSLIIKTGNDPGELSLTTDTTAGLHTITFGTLTDKLKIQDPNGQSLQLATDTVTITAADQIGLVTTGDGSLTLTNDLYIDIDDLNIIAGNHTIELLPSEASFNLEGDANINATSTLGSYAPSVSIDADTTISLAAASGSWTVGDNITGSCATMALTGSAYLLNGRDRTFFLTGAPNKGTLLAGKADSSWGYIGLGTDGYVLTADSTLTGGMKWAAATATVADGDKGDITVSASGATWTIDNGAVTFQKIEEFPALSVLCNPTNATLYGATVAADANGKVFKREGNSLTFSQIVTADVAANLALTTPDIGTPSAGTLTNCTGLPISTGVSGLGSNVATFLATPSSANLASAVTGETGSGALVFGTLPTLAGVTIQSQLILDRTDPTSLTGNVDNWNPTVDGTWYRIGSDGAYSISGMVAGTASELRILVNASNFTLTYLNASASSDANNRFACVTGANITSVSGGIAIALYDGGSGRWRIGRLA